MKKANFLKYGLAIGGIVLFLLACSGIISHEFMVAAAPTASIITDTGLNTENVTTASSELLDQVISQKITKIRPSDVPLDTIFRSINRTQKATSWKYEWYKEDVIAVEDTIKTSFDNSSAGIFDSSTGIYTISVTTPALHQEDDCILVQGIDGNDGAELVLHVVAKNTTASTLDVKALNGTGPNNIDIPDLTAGTKITNMGPAKSELDAQTSPSQTAPQKTYNYNQIYMAQIEQSFIESIHKKEVNWGMSQIQEQALYNMRRKIELTTLFNVRAKTYDDNDADYKYTTGGLTRYITNTLTYTDGSLTDGKFIDWTESIFTGNNGSDNRVLFLGKNLMSQMSKITSIEKRLQVNNNNVAMFGIQFNKIVTNYGVLYVKYHKALDDVGWNKKGIVLDINNIEKFVMEPMKTRKVDLITSGIRKADATVLEETCGLALRNPATHAIIEPA